LVAIVVITISYVDHLVVADTFGPLTENLNFGTFIIEHVFVVQDNCQPFHLLLNFLTSIIDLVAKVPHSILKVSYLNLLKALAQHIILLMVTLQIHLQHIHQHHLEHVKLNLFSIHLFSIYFHYLMLTGLSSNPDFLIFKDRSVIER